VKLKATRRENVLTEPAMKSLIGLKD